MGCTPNALTIQIKCGRNALASRPVNGNIGAQVATTSPAKMGASKSLSQTTRMSASIRVKCSQYEYTKMGGYIEAVSYVRDVRKFAVPSLRPTMKHVGRPKKRPVPIHIITMNSNAPVP